MTTIPQEDTFDGSVADVEGRSQTYAALVWRSFRKSRVGMVGLVLVIVILVSSIFADFIAPSNPKERFQTFGAPTNVNFFDVDGGFHIVPFFYPVGDTGTFDPITFQPVVGEDTENPVGLRLFVRSWDYRLFGVPTNIHLLGTSDGTPFHLMGTDKLGRDIFSRALVGSRISLMIALIVVTVVTIIGTVTGIASGYLGGRFDGWFQRFVELILAFPELPLYLALTSIIPVTVPSKIFIAFVVILLSGLKWAQLSREARGKTLALRNVDFVKAAVAVGTGDWRIIWRHILPNVVSHIIVSVTIAIPNIVLLESFLGFLGFAVKPPLISWGLMLQDTSDVGAIGSFPWLLWPVGFILLTVLSFNALGDGLRDAVDPYNE